MTSFTIEDDLRGKTLPYPMRDGVPGECKRSRGQPFEAAAFGTTSFIIEDDRQGTILPYPMRDGVLVNVNVRAVNQMMGRNEHRTRVH